MTQGKNIFIMFVVLAIGFGVGFVLRPVIAPPEVAAVGVPARASAQSTDARGIQYFEANIDEARQVLEGCRDGPVRGAECANAEEAIIKVGADERRRRFLGE